MFETKPFLPQHGAGDPPAYTAVAGVPIVGKATEYSHVEYLVSLKVKLGEFQEQIEASRREDLNLLLPQVEEEEQALRTILDGAKARFSSARDEYTKKFMWFHRWGLSPFRHVYREAKAYKREHLEPRLKTMSELRNQQKAVVELKKTLVESNTTEVRRSPVSVCGVYNPVTGKVEWQSYADSTGGSGGLMGVWNPTSESIEWRSKRDHGISGVYNPVTKAVEWREHRLGCVCGVWNPDKMEVEWRSSWIGGVHGVYNPLTRTVKWAECRGGGVVGWFDSSEGKVVWRKEVYKNLCAITWNPTNKTYETSCSNTGMNLVRAQVQERLALGLITQNISPGVGISPVGGILGS